MGLTFKQTDDGLLTCYVEKQSARAIMFTITTATATQIRYETKQTADYSWARLPSTQSKKSCEQRLNC